MKTFTTSRGTRIQQIAGGRSNVFLVSGPSYRLLVDTGPQYKGTRLTGTLQNKAGGKVDGLLLTHTHLIMQAMPGWLKKPLAVRSLCTGLKRLTCFPVIVRCLQEPMFLQSC